MTTKHSTKSTKQAPTNKAVADLVSTGTEQLEDQKKRGRKPRVDKDNKNATAAEKGTKPGETRKTYLVNKGIAEQIEAIAYWDRESIKDVVNRALSNYIREYALDRKNKDHVLPSLSIKPIPVKK